jgi:hypothetical protein
MCDREDPFTKYDIKNFYHFTDKRNLQMTPHRTSARSAIPEERSWNAIWKLSSLSMIRGKES